MARVRWKKDAVVSLRVKGDLWVLGQMLPFPYLLFFNRFESQRSWNEAPTVDQVLFPCAVTRQFLTCADLQREKIPPVCDYVPPNRWIEAIHGSRYEVFWKGTPHERTVPLLSEEPGGRLVEEDIDGDVSEWKEPLATRISLTDDESIDGYERSVIWTFPLLNERLHLCQQLGRIVDPGKDIMFGRPLSEAYRTYVDILADHGALTEWGYGDMA